MQALPVIMILAQTIVIFWQFHSFGKIMGHHKQMLVDIILHLHEVEKGCFPHDRSLKEEYVSFMGGEE